MDTTVHPFPFTTGLKSEVAAKFYLDSSAVMGENTQAFPEALPYESAPSLKKVLKG